MTDLDSKGCIDSVADRIVFLRRSLGLTQSEFAKKLGYSASYVNRLEHGLIDCRRIDGRKDEESDKSDALDIPGKPSTSDTSDIPYGHERFLIKVYKTFGTDLKWLIGESDELPEVIRDAQDASNEVDAQKLASGERLRKVRTDNNLTVRQFASVINASTNTVVNTEKGHRDITRQYAKRIEDTFGVSVDWILYGDEFSKNYPLTDKMAEYMKKHEEVRKYVWRKMMEEEDDLIGSGEMSRSTGD